MKNIFVTGAAGFLGRFLVKELKKNYQVDSPSSVECNLLNFKDLKKIKKKYHYIYHLAAWTQAGDFCLKYPGQQWILNQQINTNLIIWWKNFQPQAKLIFIGTSCSYPENTKKLTESNYMSGEPIESLYTYAMTKRMLLQGAIACQKEFNLKWLCFVPSTLYGPRYHTDGRQMHFIFDLITKIINGKLNKKKVTLWGDGNQKREIIHVEDFISAILFLVNKKNNEIINIGSGKEYTIKEFAKKICKILDYNFNKIYFDKKKYVGARSKKLDISKLKKYYRNYVRNNKKIDGGLRQTINWFLKNQVY